MDIFNMEDSLVFIPPISAVDTLGAGFNFNSSQLMDLPRKESALSLADEINSSNEGVGAVIYILDQNSAVTHATNNFYLTNASMSSKEKVQVTEMMDSAYVAFFGAGVKVYSFSGVALDWASAEQPYHSYFHQSSLIKLYEDSMRGSKLIKSGSRAVLKVANHLVTGYPINLTVDYNSTADKLGQFRMNWLVLSHKLSSPGIVTEDQLKQMSYVSHRGVDNTYRRSIEKIIQSIDGFVLIEKWGDFGSQDSPSLKSLKNILGNYSLTSITEHQLRSIRSELQNVFKAELPKKLMALNSVLSEAFGKNEDKIVSPTIKKFFISSNNLKTVIDEINTAIPNLFSREKSENSFKLLYQFLQKLIILKNQLLVFQSRMVG